MRALGDPEKAGLRLRARARMRDVSPRPTPYRCSDRCPWVVWETAPLKVSAGAGAAEPQHLANTSGSEATS